MHILKVLLDEFLRGGYICESTAQVKIWDVSSSTEAFFLLPTTQHPSKVTTILTFNSVESFSPVLNSIYMESYFIYSLVYGFFCCCRDSFCYM